MSIINYPMECPSCSGSGQIEEYPTNAMNTVLSRTCKACGGSGVVTVSEVRNGLDGGKE